MLTEWEDRPDNPPSIPPQGARQGSHVRPMHQLKRGAKLGMLGRGPNAPGQVCMASKEGVPPVTLPGKGMVPRDPCFWSCSIIKKN